MKHLKAGIAAGGALAFAIGTITAPALAQKKGGTLSFVVGSKIPSYDGHAESTFGMIHPIRPFYSLLMRVNPDNPGDPTDLVCDVCEGRLRQGEKPLCVTTCEDASIDYKEVVVKGDLVEVFEDIVVRVSGGSTWEPFLREKTKK